MIVTMLSAAGALTSPASAASCPNNNWANYSNAVIPNAFSSNGVNIRTGNSTSCTSLGHGQKKHTVRIHCVKGSNGPLPWVRLRNESTSVAGWVRADNLTHFPVRECPKPLDV